MYVKFRLITPYFLFTVTLVPNNILKSTQAQNMYQYLSDKSILNNPEQTQITIFGIKNGSPKTKNKTTIKINNVKKRLLLLYILFPFRFS